MSTQERASRLQSLQTKLGSFKISGQYEPSHQLVDAFSSMLSDQSIRHVPLNRCSCREQEVSNVKRDEHLLRLENAGLTPSLQASAFEGRPLHRAQGGLAIEMAGLGTFDVHEAYARSLLEHLHRPQATTSAIRPPRHRRPPKGRSRNVERNVDQGRRRGGQRPILTQDPINEGPWLMQLSSLTQTLRDSHSMLGQPRLPTSLCPSPKSLTSYPTSVLDQTALQPQTRERKGKAATQIGKFMQQAWQSGKSGKVVRAIRKRLRHRRPAASRFERSGTRTTRVRPRLLQPHVCRMVVAKRHAQTDLGLSGSPGTLEIFA